MPTVLIADKTDALAKQILEAAGITVITETGLKEDQLAEKAKTVDGIIVRSESTITRKILQSGAGKLKIVGRAGVGVDNIDLDAATEIGIIVENTPFGNITSAAEHALALMMSLSRKIPSAHEKMKAGVWAKKENTGVEMDGKTLGIVGLGKVGAIVARVGQALHMKVIVFDPFLTDKRASELNVEKTDLDPLLAKSDFITLHTPLTDKTRNMIDKSAFDKMKKGARLINAARGGIVDEQALADALADGKIAGAAVDVFSEEPYPGGPLTTAPNIVLTPHLGASTSEAQVKVAEQIAEQFVAFFNEGRIVNSSNLSVALDPTLAPFADLAANVGKLVAQLADNAVEQLTVGCYGKIAEKNTRQIALFALKGLLTVGSDSPVTLVNAERIAANRGLTLLEQKSETRRNYVSVVTLTAKTATSEVTASCALFDGSIPKIVEIQGFDVDLKPADTLLVMTYSDRPGMVGKIGTILGDARINIADMVVGRKKKGETALVVLTLDDTVSDETLRAIRESVEPLTLTQVRM